MKRSEYKLTYEESDSNSRDAKGRLEAAYDFLFEQVLEESAKHNLKGASQQVVAASREPELLTEASGEISLN